MSGVMDKEAADFMIRIYGAPLSSGSWAIPPKSIRDSAGGADVENLPDEKELTGDVPGKNDEPKSSVNTGGPVIHG